MRFDGRPQQWRHPCSTPIQDGPKATDDFLLERETLTDFHSSFTLLALWAVNLQ